MFSTNSVTPEWILKKFASKRQSCRHLLRNNVLTLGRLCITEWLQLHNLEKKERNRIITAAISYKKQQNKSKRLETVILLQFSFAC